MALRLLKKFDELDRKERILTGTRRSRYKRLTDNPDRRTARSHRRRPQSAGVPVRRVGGSRNSRRSQRPQSAIPQRRARPRSAIGTRGRPVAFRRQDGGPVSPKNRPAAPEVENVFGGGKDVGSKQGGNGAKPPPAARRPRPASAGPLRIRTDRFGGGGHARKRNDRKLVSSSCKGWNRNMLTRGSSFKAPGSIGETKVDISRRIVHPQFYFLRVCVQGMVEDYGGTVFDVQVTDLSDENRPAHWYTDLVADPTGHLLFRPHPIPALKSRFSTRTVISPIHDFHWVKTVSQMYGHAVRVQVYEQQGHFQTMFIDRCAYYGKADPAISAMSKSYEQSSLVHGISLKKKKQRPTTAPDNRITRRAECMLPASGEITPRPGGVSPKKRPGGRQRGQLSSDLDTNGSSPNAKAQVNPRASTRESPRLAKVGARELPEKKNAPKTPRELEIINLQKQISPKNPPSPFLKSKVKLSVPPSPKVGSPANGRSLSGWKRDGMSPSPFKSGNTGLRISDGASPQALRRQKESANGLEVVAKAHSSPYLKSRRDSASPRSSPKERVGEEEASSYEALKTYRKQILNSLRAENARASRHLNEQKTRQTLLGKGNAMQLRTNPVDVAIRKKSPTRSLLVDIDKATIPIPVESKFSDELDEQEKQDRDLAMFLEFSKKHAKK